MPIYSAIIRSVVEFCFDLWTRRLWEKLYIFPIEPLTHNSENNPKWSTGIWAEIQSKTEFIPESQFATTFIKADKFFGLHPTIRVVHSFFELSVKSHRNIVDILQIWFLFDYFLIQTDSLIYSQFSVYVRTVPECVSARVGTKLFLCVHSRNICWISVQTSII